LLILIINVFWGTVGVGVVGRGKIGIGATCNAITIISGILFQIAAIFLGFGAAGLVGGMAAGLLLGSYNRVPFF